MTVVAAIRELRGTMLPDRYNKLVLAWNRCSDDKQVRFLLHLANAGLITLDASEAAE